MIEKEFRENIRLLERALGLLKPDSSIWLCKNITLAQCHALIEIGRKSDITLKDLAGTLQLDTSTTSRAVDALVKKGYVNRIQSQVDRRSIILSLTEEGNNIYGGIEQNMSEQYRQVLDQIPVDQRENVVDSLKLMIHAFNHVQG